MEGLQPGFDATRARAFRRRAARASRGQQFTWQHTGGQWSEEGRSFTDILNEMFGGLGRQARGVPGADIEHPIEIGLLDAIRGRSVTVAVGGQTRLNVKIPPGVDTGARVRVAGKGEPGQFGGPPGDLYLVVTVLPHPFLQRQGQDLYLDVPITVREAISGASVTVPTPTGKVRLKVPPGSQSGRLLRLRGGGIRDPKTHARGDLLVRLLVHVPTNGTRDVQEAADTLERAYGGDPRRHLRL
jgi:DnaJ-class molecular chaperone